MFVLPPRPWLLTACSLFVLSCSADSVSGGAASRGNPDSGAFVPSPDASDDAGAAVAAPMPTEPEPTIDASLPEPGPSDPVLPGGSVAPSASAVPTNPAPTVPSLEPEPVTPLPQPEPVTPLPEPEPEPVDALPEPVDVPPPRDPAPAGWTCGANHYADGNYCHCGCGVRDADCTGASADECEVCLTPGSCSGGACPSSIAQNDNSLCDVPEEWTCQARYFGDGQCHCGCGVLDMDCTDASRVACDICYLGCSTESCPGTIDAADNTICTGVPSAWTCEPRFFADGALCHCGCGVLDPDCDSGESSACDRCDYSGSCSARACPGTIDPGNNAVCYQPVPPAEWTCDAYQYADGYYCDCGCGALDLDCADAAVETCEQCYTCGGNCAARVDPNDTTQCLPVPDEWNCDSFLYRDGYTCHCGCGIVDPDCDSASASSCHQCGYVGCDENYDCSDIVPDDNAHCVDEAPPGWTCDPDFYADEACDCGCGMPDVDCTTGAVAVCDFCNASGSCSTTVCPGAIDPANNAVCAE